MTRSLRLLLALGALLLGPAVVAEQFQDQGEYRIHYNALNSTELTPEIARRFGVTRSRQEALLVLSPQRRDEQGRYRPVAAQGEGRARTLLGHVTPLKLRPVREGEAHYLVAPFEVLDGEFVRLELSVLPAGADRPIALSFQQQFYRGD